MVLASGISKTVSPFYCSLAWKAPAQTKTYSRKTKNFFLGQHIDIVLKYTMHVGIHLFKSLRFMYFKRKQP